MRSIEPLRPEDPERIGRYTLAGRLGEGGQGLVYRAAGDDGTPVALKVLHPRLLRGPQAYDRLSEEIVLVRRVADFCTAWIIESGTDGGRSYVVSEYVDGAPVSGPSVSVNSCSEGRPSRCPWCLHPPSPWARPSAALKRVSPTSASTETGPRDGVR